MTYGLFSFYGFNFIFDGEHDYDAAKVLYGDDYSNDKCHTYNDNSDLYEYESKTIHEVAKGMGLLTVLVLALSILLASFLVCKDFSRKLIHWIQFCLIIACLSSSSLLWLVPQEDYAYTFDRSNQDVEFKIKQGGFCAFWTAVFTFLCLIFTCFCKCKKLPEPDDDENKNVKAKVGVKVEAPVHVPDEEAEIHLPKEVEPQVYVV